MYCTAALVTVSIAAGLLVMVSSELVVLLIVCVGINTGSAQQGELAQETTIIKACILCLEDNNTKFPFLHIQDQK